MAMRQKQIKNLSFDTEALLYAAMSSFVNGEIVFAHDTGRVYRYASGSLMPIGEPSISIIAIVDMTTAEPTVMSVGDSYRNTVTGNSNVTTTVVTANYIYTWDGIAWAETIPVVGTISYNTAESIIYVHNGSIWDVVGAGASVALDRVDLQITDSSTLTITTNIIPIGDPTFNTIDDPSNLIVSTAGSEHIRVAKSGVYIVLCALNKTSTEITSRFVHNGIVKAIIRVRNGNKAVYKWIGNASANDTFYFTIDNSTISEVDIIVQQIATSTYIPNTALIVDDKATSDYIDLGAMRMQWGVFPLASDSETAVTLPAAFATSAYSVNLGIEPSTGFTTSGTIEIPVGIKTLTTTTFGLDRDNDITGTINVHWQAFGLKP